MGGGRFYMKKEKQKSLTDHGDGTVAMARTVAIFQKAM